MNEIVYSEKDDEIKIYQNKVAIEELRRSWQIQTVLYDLVRLLLENISLQEALQRVISTVTSVPWLALESKGGIFLIEENPPVLVLKAHRNLPLPLQSMCSHVPLGRCLCGLAASSGRIEFADRVDDRHENRWPGMREHGHYCIPIKSRDKVIGVFYLHLKEGHVRDEKEEEFLSAAADLLAGIINRKRLEEELSERNVTLQQRVQELSALNGVFQQHLEMRQERDAFYQSLIQNLHTMAVEASRVLQEVRQVGVSGTGKSQS